MYKEVCVCPCVTKTDRCANLQGCEFGIKRVEAFMAFKVFVYEEARKQYVCKRFAQNQHGLNQMLLHLIIEAKYW